MAPVSASSSATASPARKGASQAPTKRSHRSTSLVAAARAGEGVDRGHQHGQQQRAGEQRDHPAREHLAHREQVATGPCAGLRPWSSAVTVRSVARPSAPSRFSSISSTGPSPGGGSSPLPEIRTAS